ncbi:MAG: ABC-F family ATP-binding cassette domain-containing protein, partial [Clostridia bacterium]|nr:ABC-F family ATP-binding cassette domain-containing protein [Clostridia bacterium]
MRLYLSDVSVSFGEKEVLKNINFEVNKNDKVAIIGRNGCGKTTLLKVITGEQDIDSSFQHNVKDKIQKTGKFEIGYLKQIAFDDDSETFENEILKVYKNILDLKSKIEVLEHSMSSGANKDVIKYDDMLRQFDIIGGYTYQKEYNTAIKKFGFSEEDKYKKLSEFSGGQRTRHIVLCQIILNNRFHLLRKGQRMRRQLIHIVFHL